MIGWSSLPVIRASEVARPERPLTTTEIVQTNDNSLTTSTSVRPSIATISGIDISNPHKTLSSGPPLTRTHYCKEKIACSVCSVALT
jgi:hypothetical protein